MNRQASAVGLSASRGPGRTLAAPILIVLFAAACSADSDSSSEPEPSSPIPVDLGLLATATGDVGDWNEPLLLLTVTPDELVLAEAAPPTESGQPTTYTTDLVEGSIGLVDPCGPGGVQPFPLPGFAQAPSVSVLGGTHGSVQTLGGDGTTIGVGGRRDAAAVVDVVAALWDCAGAEPVRSTGSFGEQVTVSVVDLARDEHGDRSVVIRWQEERLQRHDFPSGPSQNRSTIEGFAAAVAVDDSIIVVNHVLASWYVNEELDGTEIPFPDDVPPPVTIPADRRAALTDEFVAGLAAHVRTALADRRG